MLSTHFMAPPCLISPHTAPGTATRPRELSLLTPYKQPHHSNMSISASMSQARPQALAQSGSTATTSRDALPSSGSLTSSATSVWLESPQQAKNLLDSIDTLILDCDGVLWQGSRLIHNAAEALQAFRRCGKRLLFVTNNSSKSRAGYVSKFKSLGLEVAAQEIVSSSYAAAAYLDSVGFNQPAGSRKVLLLGSSGCEEELTEAGIAVVDAAMCIPDLRETDAMLALQVDKSIGAVVVGWDPSFSYSRLVYASVCLRELPGCLFVATNTDSADNIGGGRMMPGTGGLVAAVEVASGRTATVVGKGGPWLLPFLCSKYQLQASRTCIIGDRLDTDIALGKEGGLMTILPLTGVCTQNDVSAAPASEQPDYVIPSIAVLAGLPVS